MDMLTGLDVPSGDTDDLVVPMQRLARGDTPSRQLVPRRDQSRHHEAFCGYGSAAHQLMASDHHVIVRMKADDRRRSVHAGALHVGPVPRPFFVSMHRCFLGRVHQAGRT